LETVSTIRPSLQDVALGNSQYRPPIITGRRAWKQSVPSAHHYRTSRLETVSTIRPSLQDVALGNSQYRPPIITGRRAWKQSVPSAVADG
jgi:hypothetical protein